MRIAFIILAHKNPAHVRRLVDKLRYESIGVYLHIDRGIPDETFQVMQEELVNASDLHWLPREYSHWGGWGLVQASLSGLKQARDANYDYVILLSGQDYLIKPLSFLVSFLEINQGKSFLQYHRLPSRQWPPDGPSRYTRWHFNLNWKASFTQKSVNRILNRLFNTLSPSRALPDNLAPFGGWQWWCLHRDCVDYVLDFTATHRWVVEFFKRVRIPDEMYFHTLLLNSPLASSVQNRMLTFVDWQGPPFPRVLVQKDFETLKTSEFFFARKIDPDVDKTIIDRIDSELLKG